MSAVEKDTLDLTIAIFMLHSMSTQLRHNLFCGGVGSNVGF